MTPHYVRPDHHPLPRGTRGDGQHEPRLPEPRRSTAPAGLFAPAPPVVRKPRPKRSSPRVRPSRATTVRDVAPCGSDSGYKRHKRDREDACRPCKDAHNAENAKYPRNRKQVQYTHDGCGTEIGWAAHRKRRERLCPACKTYSEKAAAEVTLTGNQQRVLAVLEQAGRPRTATQIGEQLGLARSSVRNSLDALTRYSIVQQKGTTMNGGITWEIAA